MVSVGINVFFTFQIRVRANFRIWDWFRSGFSVRLLKWIRIGLVLVSSGFFWLWLDLCLCKG